MALRDGMSALIERVRQLANAGEAEYSIDNTTYFRDTHIQDILDRNSTYLVQAPLKWIVSTDTGGTARYLTAQSAYRDFETDDSGTAYFYIATSAGSIIGTANYTPNHETGRITFTADQGGTSYYLTAYSFDVYGAAADVWQQRLANFADWYRFSADNQTFDRNQAFEHAEKMFRLMQEKRGANVIMNAGDIRTGHFMRVDLA